MQRNLQAVQNNAAKEAVGRPTVRQLTIKAVLRRVGSQLKQILTGSQCIRAEKLS